MKHPKDQNDRLLRIILISWFLILILFMGGVTYATVEISKIKENYNELAGRPRETVKTVETQLQPIYTTIVGEKGSKGADGKDSVSTTTIIHTETALPGPKGDSGKNGKNGVDGNDAREQEFAYDPITNTMYSRYVGAMTWVPVTIIGTP